MKFKLKLILLAIALFFATVTLLSAQPPGMPSSPSQAPIDGGLALLLSSGSAYALKKLKHKSKN